MYISYICIHPRICIHVYIFTYIYTLATIRRLPKPLRLFGNRALFFQISFATDNLLICCAADLLRKRSGKMGLLIFVLLTRLVSDLQENRLVWTTWANMPFGGTYRTLAYFSRSLSQKISSD